MAKGCICRYPFMFCNRTLAKGRICRYPVIFCTRTLAKGRICRYPFIFCNRTLAKGRICRYPFMFCNRILWQKGVSADTPSCSVTVYFGKRAYLQILHTGSMPLLWQKGVSVVALVVVWSNIWQKSVSAVTPCRMDFSSISKKNILNMHCEKKKKKKKKNNFLLGIYLLGNIWSEIKSNNEISRPERRSPVVGK